MKLFDFHMAWLVSYRIPFRSHKYLLTWQIQYQYSLAKDREKRSPNTYTIVRTGFEEG